MPGMCQVRKVFSSSLWLCDCLSHASVIRNVLEGNSMGLILDARNVHFDTTFGSEHSCLLVGQAMCAWSNKPDSFSHYEVYMMRKSNRVKH
jgi:hypothetical protein